MGVGSGGGRPVTKLRKMWDKGLLGKGSGWSKANVDCVGVLVSAQTEQLETKTWTSSAKAGHQNLVLMNVWVYLTSWLDIKQSYERWDGKAVVWDFLKTTLRSMCSHGTAEISRNSSGFSISGSPILWAWQRARRARWTPTQNFYTVNVWIVSSQPGMTQNHRNEQDDRGKNVGSLKQWISIQCPGHQRRVQKGSRQCYMFNHTGINKIVCSRINKDTDLILLTIPLNSGRNRFQGGLDTGCAHQYSLTY